jgi:hypothetical protein
MRIKIIRGAMIEAAPSKRGVEHNESKRGTI